ncbi:carboxymuconolactone decarboxylase family protein [Methylobacterium sp. CM6244]
MIAISLRRDERNTVHTDTTRKFGVSEGELGEALGVATTINAGAAVVYATRALNAYAASTEA